MKEEFVVCECGKFDGLFLYGFGCADCSCGRRISPILQNLRSVRDLADDAEEARRLEWERRLR